MKVIALDPGPHGVRVAVAALERLRPEVTLCVRFTISESDDRAAGLAQLRLRVHSLVREQQPDAVVVKPLEPMALKADKRRVTYAWFQTAEVRGVVAEAARSADAPVQFWNGAAVTRAMGGRKGADCVDDETFWSDEVAGTVRSGDRKVALLAVSRLRQG